MHEKSRDFKILVHANINMCIFAQFSFFLPGISGAGLTYALTPSTSRYSLGDTVLNENVSTIQGLFVEFILTFILSLTVYATKDPGRKCRGYDSSLAYGFAIVVCYLVGVRVYTHFCKIILYVSLIFISALKF